MAGRKIADRRAIVADLHIVGEIAEDGRRIAGHAPFQEVMDAPARVIVGVLVRTPVPAMHISLRLEGSIRPAPSPCPSGGLVCF